MLADVVTNLRQRSQSIRAREVGHARESGKCDKYGRRIGLVVVMLTTAIGTTAFAELGNHTGTWPKVVVGVIAALAAVLAAVKENAAYGKSSSEHAKAASEFGQLHHDFEALLLTYERGELASGHDFDAELDKLNKREADVMLKAIPLRDRAYDWAAEWVKTH